MRGFEYTSEPNQSPPVQSVDYSRKSSASASASLDPSSTSRSRTISHRAASRSSSRERDYRKSRDWSHSPDYRQQQQQQQQQSSSSSARRSRTISSYDQRSDRDRSKRDRSRDAPDKRTPRTPPPSPPPSSSSRLRLPRTPERDAKPPKLRPNDRRSSAAADNPHEASSRMRSPALPPPPQQVAALRRSSSTAGTPDRGSGGSLTTSPTPENAAKTSALADADASLHNRQRNRSPLQPIEPFEPILSDDEDIAMDDDLAADADADADAEVARTAAAAAAAAASGSSAATPTEQPSTPVAAAAPAQPPPRSPTPEPIIDDSDVDYNTLPNVLLQFDPHRCSAGDLIADRSSDADAISLSGDPLAAPKELIFAHKLLQRFSEQPFCCTPAEFTTAARMSADAQELWVHSGEHLLQALQLVHTHFAYAPRRRALDALVGEHCDALVLLLRCGLDWSCAMAQPQPAYKLRHLKIGARLAELLGGCTPFVGVLLFRERFDVFGRLFELYGEKYMALSIRLQLLRAIGACLDTRCAMEYFLQAPDAASPVYRQVVGALQANPPTRAKFALRALLKKVNLYEALQLVREICVKCFVAGNRENEGTDHQLLAATLAEIWRAMGGGGVGALAYQQPRRFLPVAAKFEIAEDRWAQRAAAATLRGYFECHAFAETLLVLLAHRAEPHRLPQNVLALVVRCVERLARTTAGLEYLSGCGALGAVLVKCLLGSGGAEAEEESSAAEGMDVDDAGGAALAGEKATALAGDRFHALGVEISIRLRTKRLLDQLVGTAPEDGDELVSILHTLYSLCAQPAVRQHCCNTIAMPASIVHLLETIDRERKLLGSLKTPAVINSPIIGYALDILEQTVRHAQHVDYLAEHGAALADLVKSALLAAHNKPAVDDATVATLQELAVLLKPVADVPDAFAFDNGVVALCEQLRLGAEFVVQFPGDVITTVRILHHLAIGGYEEAEAEAAEQLPPAEHTELRFKYVVLQLFGADAGALFIGMLDKICAHFEQPHLHRAQLATAQGVLMAHVVRPIVQILQRMLAYVIRACDAQFRDLTAVEPLLRTYALAHSVPAHAQAAQEAREICRDVVRALLAYTQPSGSGSAGGVAAPPATEEATGSAADTKPTSANAAAGAAAIPDAHEAVHKSLWTQMCGEVLKFTAQAPCNFIAGLSVLSAMLPCTLPVLTLQPLADAECTRLITERQLWSAHLHPKSPELAVVLQTVAASPHPDLRRLFERLCQQLADLAPNMSLLVAKAVVELFLTTAAAVVAVPAAAAAVQTTPTAGVPATASATSPPAGAGTVAAAAPVVTAGSSAAVAAASAAGAAGADAAVLQLHVLRLLVKLARRARVKVALLSMLPGKLNDVLMTIVKIGPTGTAQRLVIELVQALMCPQVRLESAIEGGGAGLANALPGKQLMPLLVVAAVEYFLASRSAVALRTMQMMAGIE